MNYWLMKSEPSTFSIDDLAASPRKTTAWDGVRNFQARNMLRDDFRAGDLAFFYHSSCDQPGVVGVMEVVKGGYADPSQFNPKSRYFDPASDRDAPRWFCVDVKLKRRLGRVIGLDELRRQDPLAKLTLLQRGNRLSVMPVAKADWDFILALE
jgi:predicted RNA-binding protein with PUA-like domain